MVDRADLSNGNPHEFKAGDRVRYITQYGNEKANIGFVSSVNDHYVFVKFDDSIALHGWDGSTSEACRCWTLVKLSK